MAHDGREERQEFDAVFLCTGLVGQRVPVESKSIPVTEDPAGIRDSTVVVVGGGESATDVANYLAKPEHHNRVYLSLRSGIRVSPRYHPIRGVPSDFLRNRLLLSFDKRLRNWVGERFVTFRIRWTGCSPAGFHANANTRHGSSALRREWDLKLRPAPRVGCSTSSTTRAMTSWMPWRRADPDRQPSSMGMDQYHDFDRSRGCRSPRMCWSRR
jgi:cation diffusion facilitator CzcD-associated flavoprotein CzcO